MPISIDTNELINKFKSKIEELEEFYIKASDDYFFTEKELHSYFYHLCLSEPSFHYKKSFLIHTEYPTPFKYFIKKENPYFEIVQDVNDVTSKQYVRSHVDLVLLNPKFIEWIKGKTHKGYNPIDYIKGLRNELFSTYITKFYELYKDFADTEGETVLLYALEFKYFRNLCEGTKYSIKGITQDVEKLRNLKSFKVNGSKLAFCKNIKSLVFIGEKVNKEKLRTEFMDDNNDIKFIHNILSEPT